jgi:oligoendopeptidase F
MTAAVIPTRDQIATEHTWDLSPLYATTQDWEADFARLDGLLEPVLARRGRLDSPEAIAALFADEDTLHQTIERLHTYAHLREDEDTANAMNQARMQRMRARYAELLGKTAWITPEILAHPTGTLEAWRESEPLRPYRYTMTLLLRRKAHTLSEAEETLLSRAAEIFGAPSTIFSLLTNADMKFPDVPDEQGVPQPLTNGRYVPMLESRDRGVRQRAFESLHDSYIGFGNTLATTLATAVKVRNYNASIRGFGSALEASLHNDNVPVALYETLLDATNEALPILHEYVALRREVLGLDDLNMWDLYVPIVPDFKVEVPWDRACEQVRDSLRPLGERYGRGVTDAFTQRWVDVFENKGKRSGAYSSGCFGSPPYMLMNYQGTLDGVFTLAHELGHSMHSWLAHRAQPYRYADYTIFVAEIASTTNEALLHRHLLDTTDDPRMKAYLLNHLCDQFRGTVYRQVMFATFEKMIHEMNASGEPLTAETLSEAYYALNARFQGPLIKADRRIAHEWSRIPHFYYNFYVYKYATGFCAAQVFARRILESAGGRDGYLAFLESGGSDDPLELTRRAGVDLTRREVLTDAFETFRGAVRELRGLLVG